MPAPKAVEIIEFWQQAGPQRWFAKDHAFGELLGAYGFRLRG